MDGLVAFEPRVPGLVQEVDVQQLGQTATCSGGPFDGNFDQSQPALAAASSDYMLYVQRAFPGGAPHPGDIWFAALHPNRSCKIGDGDALPAIVNATTDESRPALTPDGRYVGFVRHTSDAHSRLFIWDSQTQLLVNNAGIDLGVLSTREIDLIAAHGNLSLRTAFVLKSALINPSGIINAQILINAGIGILVQRVVGHQQLLGRTAPKLKLVGRVPLGRFSRGSVHVRWDRKVDGRRLAPGLYQITVRALAPNGRVEDLGRPRAFRIR